MLQFFKYDKTLPEHKFFIFLMGRYFVMGDPINMNVDLFWKTSAGFLKIAVS